jgi:hypothetical protein
VIVKSQAIRQNHDDVHRQIKECELPRLAEGGKKNIVISEIWVVTSKDITKNAQDFLNLEYKTKKLKFIDGDQLVKLIERYYPAYFEFANAARTSFISNQLSTIKAIGRLHRLLPSTSEPLYIDRQIQSISMDSKRKFVVTEPKASKLLDEIKKKRAVYLEGGMGAGKSELFRSTAQMLCEDSIIDELKLIPYLTTYREIVGNADFSISNLVTEIREKLADEDKTIVFFIDGLDESPEENSDKVDFICKISNELLAFEKIKLVVSSRVIEDLSLVEKLEKSFERYTICPLTYGSLVSLVEKVCNGVILSEKFRGDLQRSSLMKSLPRTPMSAILLGKLLSENITELPSTLPELYAKYTELVLGRWDLEKGNGSEKEYETILRLICILASYMFEHDAEFIAVSQLRDMFDEYLSERRTGQNTQELLAAFLKRGELLCHDVEAQTVRFRHRTFAEFFYAFGLFHRKGMTSDIVNPFHPYWHGIEYFYLGLIRDAPDRISALAAYVPPDEIQRIIKLSQFGSLLMAAYQTPFSTIERALYSAFKDAAFEYCNALSPTYEGWFKNLSELQLLALLTSTIRDSYQYEFFKPALIEAKVQAELDLNLSEENKLVFIFFVDAVLAALGDKSAFVSLAERHEVSLSWSLRLGIKFAGQDVSLVNEATKRMDRKLHKSRKDNPQLGRYFNAIQSEPLKDRADIRKILSLKK